MKTSRDVLASMASNYEGIAAAWQRARAMTPEELAALKAEPVTNCPHGMADPKACEDCHAPAVTVDPREIMRIPSEFYDARLSGLPKPLLDGIGPFMASWPPARPMLWLGGNVGAGKTYTACAILRAIHANRGVPGRFWTVAEIVAHYRAASSTDYTGPWTAERLDAALTLAPLVVIDDLGTERKTEFVGETLYRLVDARHRERRPTIVTTNVSADALDHRIRSRLLSGIQVDFTGPDRRMQ